LEVTYLSDEHERLSKDVEVLFRQATSRFAVPTASGCAMVAFYLLGLRDTPQKHDKQPKAVRYGKLFLYHLSAERRQVEYWIALYSQGQPVEFWFRRDQELLEKIDEAQRSVETLLPALSPKRDARDPIRQVAAAAKQAWGETNGGRAPRSTNPDGPLCRFLAGALAKIGQERSAAEISEVLRSRRRKPRGGQIL
jgi:hypothetical protein